MAATKQTMRYEVRFTITVDAPDRRGPSFPEVAAGTKIQMAWSYPTQRQAVHVFDAIRNGEHDFGSEYVSSAEVVRIAGEWKISTVRRSVSRKRAIKLYTFTPKHAGCFNVRVIRNEAA